jgi:predicted DNA binding protein
MLNARLRVALPSDTWISDVSRNFPNAEFRLLTGVALDDEALELGEVLGESVGSAVDAARSHPNVSDYNLLYSDDRRALARYRTSDAGLYDLAVDTTLPPEYPVIVRDGWFVYELSGSREEFDALRGKLEEAGLAYELVSLVTRSASAGLLTDRQREVLGVARSAGYYEVPRRTTLQSVAERVGIDKSTASEILRRAEGRLVDWYLREEADR